MAKKKSKLGVGGFTGGLGPARTASCRQTKRISAEGDQSKVAIRGCLEVFCVFSGGRKGISGLVCFFFFVVVKD
jgi:hypothetical protein